MWVPSHCSVASLDLLTPLIQALAGQKPTAHAVRGPADELPPDVTGIDDASSPIAGVLPVDRRISGSSTMRLTVIPFHGGHAKAASEGGLTVPEISHGGPFFFFFFKLSAQGFRIRSRGST